MNTTTYADGRTEGRIFYTREEAAANARDMLTDPRVRAVETIKLADMPDDYPCPCRSGMKYGRCCKRKA
jgi:uncharacterized protein YecA (UPF0149 family)